jgi:hypothetical protein
MLPERFAPHILSKRTMPAVNAGSCREESQPLSQLLREVSGSVCTWKCEEGYCGARRRWRSTTCAHDRAALVQIASDGNDRGDGFRGDGIKGRCTRIWR